MTDPTPTRAEVYDDRVHGLLMAQADRRGAYNWGYADVHPCIAELLAKRDALRERAEAAEKERDEARAAYLAHKRLRIDVEQQAHRRASQAAPTEGEA